jgi:AcrR family transcriptional regulator
VVLENYTNWYNFVFVTKAERTTRQILEITSPIFNSKGYEGASLADLCAATGLTKGALYGNFSSKEDLAVQAFLYASEKVKSKVIEELRQHTSNKKKLIALMDFYARYVFDPPIAGGCPLLNTAIEADDHRVVLKKVVAHELESTIQFITQLIEHGKRDKEFRPRVNAREYALLFFCAVEGALMMSRVSPTDEAMRIVVKKCRQLINEISLKSTR